MRGIHSRKLFDLSQNNAQAYSLHKYTTVDGSTVMIDTLSTTVNIMYQCSREVTAHNNIKLTTDLHTCTAQSQKQPSSLVRRCAVYRLKLSFSYFSIRRASIIQVSFNIHELGLFTNARKRVLYAVGLPHLPLDERDSCYAMDVDFMSPFYLNE